MKVLILEDSIEDAESIQKLYTSHCSKCNSFDVAHSFIKMHALYSKEDYEVLYLNIDNYTAEIFDFLKSKVKDHTQVVITSKESNLMIEAHKHKIAGYLSKPYNAEQFIKVITRMSRTIEICNPKDEEDYAHFKSLIADGQFNRIALTTLDGYVIVHYDDIVRCEANGNYTSVYFNDGSFLMLTKTLKHYASKLEGHSFFRVHKTHLVNLNYIRSYVKGRNSYVELTDGSNIEVSSRKKQTLVEILNN